MVLQKWGYDEKWLIEVNDQIVVLKWGYNEKWLIEVNDRNQDIKFVTDSLINHMLVRSIDREANRGYKGSELNCKQEIHRYTINATRNKHFG